MNQDDQMREAVAWHAARAHGADLADGADWDAFTAWLEADPANREAYDSVALADALVDEHHDTLVGLLAATAPAPWWRRRGFAAGAEGGAVAASLLAILVAVPGGPTPPRARNVPPPPPRVTEIDAFPAPIPDVVVTARKIAEAESSIPASVVVYTPSRADRTGANAGSRAGARTVGGLTAIDAGPDAGRLFIRGVADTPFSGYGQSPVSVEIDEARATFDAPDPDLRMVDVARVELLTGPQGPLYGTGALGGVYRVELNPPNPAAPAARFRYDLGGVEGGGPSASGEAMVNLPVANGQGAVRAVAYGELAPDWIRDVGRPGTLNQTRSWGARLV